ncbi:hypothetical protein [Actinokineospora cianjurensis]|uniref:Uncharacterized protein n=1 Tax=Actinokineospora cianjurensis TaxID=585224 RepID=A0A421AW42_9PSEU|nr:hypothetical protein [Actinokineospora cianjurensis]RLK54133.1 hypothetical protein CLV68_6135 [Actinokineospora cianjurensis]
MLEELAALAAAGGTALVEAAATDAWETTKQRIAAVLGGGDSRKVELAETRMESTRAELASLTGADLDQARAAHATVWTTRLRDAIEERPEAADDLREVLVALPATGISISGGVYVAGNSTTVATSGGIAATVINGGASTSGNPPQPGAAKG